MCVPTRIQIVAGDQVALVAGEVEPDPVGLLGAERVEHGLEVAQRPRGEVVALGGVDVELVERPSRSVELVAGASTSTPALAAFLMLRRHCWFIPLSTSSSVRGSPSASTSGIWKLYCGWPAAKPPSTDCGRQPSSRSWETTRAPTGCARSGGTSVSERTDSSAMPSLTWAAFQRRVTTGGPIRMPKAPWPLQVGGHRVEPGAEVVGRPVDHRALGQVGEVALDLGQLAVEHQRGAHELLAAVVEPADRLARATPA